MLYVMRAAALHLRNSCCTQHVTSSQHVQLLPYRLQQCSIQATAVPIWLIEWHASCLNRSDIFMMTCQLGCLAWSYIFMLIRYAYICRLLGLVVHLHANLPLTHLQVACPGHTSSS